MNTNNFNSPPPSRMDFNTNSNNNNNFRSPIQVDCGDTALGLGSANPGNNNSINSSGQSFEGLGTSNSSSSSSSSAYSLHQDGGSNFHSPPFQHFHSQQFNQFHHHNSNNHTNSPHHRHPFHQQQQSLQFAHHLSQQAPSSSSLMPPTLAQGGDPSGVINTLNEQQPLINTQQTVQQQQQFYQIQQPLHINTPSPNHHYEPLSNSSPYQHPGVIMPSTSSTINLSPQQQQQLMVPMKPRKASHQGRLSDVITSLLTDDPHQMETAESRKSTVDYTGGFTGSNGFDSLDSITPTLPLNNGQRHFVSHTNWPEMGMSTDCYRRKESLPCTFAYNNNSSSLLAAPSYLVEKCERSRSMSTVCAPYNANYNNSFNHTQSFNPVSTTPFMNPTITTTNNNHVTPCSSAAQNLTSSSSSGNLMLNTNNATEATPNSSLNSALSNRRSKSTVVSAATSVNSLHRFNSLLRKVSFVPPPGGGSGALLPPSTNNNTISPFNPLLSFTPYTPPPILSPMRSGTGLFCQLARSLGGEHKLSCRNGFDDPAAFAQQSGKNSSGNLQQQQRPQRMILVDEAASNNCQLSSSAALAHSAAMLAKSTTKAMVDTTEDEEVEDEDMTGSSSNNDQGRARRAEAEEDDEENNENCPKKRRKVHKFSSASRHHKRSHHSKVGESIDEEGGAEFDRKFSRDSNATLEDKFDSENVCMPQRKNGLFLSGAQSGSGQAFAAELEALRKESAGSSVSNLSTPFHKASIPESSITYHARMNMRNKLSIANEDFIRKMSTVSMDEGRNRKESCISDYGEDIPPETDAIPHINLGKNFQARVKKWADREITPLERAAIPDRDEAVFDAKVVDHLPQSAIAAFETLACSVAVPRPGRNKELALHILMENQGNIQAAVMDLLRSDTLDWEQYPLIFNNLYVDVDEWSSEDINSFQDAIYKSEKDFHQVAQELGSRTVKECVAFYYTWKKACPDDYRKLRNLRRKRQLLEQQLDFSSYAARERSQSENMMESSDEEFSGTESDITNPSYVNSHNMDCSPDETRAEKLARVNQSKSPVPSERKTSTIRFNVPSATLDLSMSSPLGLGSAFSSGNAGGNSSNNGGYPWLHGEMFPSPSSSTTSNTHESGNMGNYAGSSSHNPSSDIFDLSSMDSSSVFGSTGGFPVTHKVRGNVAKKGAQPSADGFFHCRLCEKRFEKVKSLNAHMKSHAMKARAEAEAQAQLQQQQSGQGGGNQRLFTGKGNHNNDGNNDMMLRDSPIGDDELNLSPLNLCQPSAAVAAAALGLNNLNRMAQQQAQSAAVAAAKMQSLFNNRDLVSAAMNQMMGGGNNQMGMAGSAGQHPSLNHHPMHQQQQQMAAMAAAAAAAAHQQHNQQPVVTLHQQIDALGGAAAVAAATSLSTLQQLHSNLQQQSQMPGFQSQQQQQYNPTTIIH